MSVDLCERLLDPREGGKLREKEGTGGKEMLIEFGNCCPLSFYSQTCFGIISVCYVTLLLTSSTSLTHSLWFTVTYL